jgi:hypothetical protein
VRRKRKRRARKRKRRRKRMVMVVYILQFHDVVVFGQSPTVMATKNIQMA